MLPQPPGSRYNPYGYMPGSAISQGADAMGQFAQAALGGLQNAGSQFAQNLGAGLGGLGAGMGSLGQNFQSSMGTLGESLAGPQYAQGPSPVPPGAPPGGGGFAPYAARNSGYGGPSASAPPGPGGFGHDATPGSTAPGYQPSGPSAPNPNIPGPTAKPVQDPAGNILGDAGTAVWSAMRSLGINPYAGDPMTKMALQRAQDIVGTVFLQAARAGIDPNDTAAVAPLMRAAVQGFVGNAPMLYSGGSGQAALQGLLGEAQQGTNDPNASPMAKILAQLVNNPATASTLGESLLYGGSPTGVRSILAGPLRDLSALNQEYAVNSPTPLPGAGQQGFLPALQRYLQGQFTPQIAPR